MKIFKTIIIAIIMIGVLVSVPLCFGACGEKNKPKVETTEVVTTIAPTTIAPTTVKPTQKVTESATEKVEATENSENKDETEEDGSSGSIDYMDVDVDDNDNMSSNNGSNNLVEDGAIYSPSEFQNAGVINWGGYQWTYYSELILPGEGLDIPGRHTTEDGYVCDGDGYVVLAVDLSMLPRYSIIDTPFGRTGKVYDTGCAYGIVDVYVGW